jgi:hypothetical protein
MDGAILQRRPAFILAAPVHRHKAKKEVNSEEWGQGRQVPPLPLRSLALALNHFDQLGDLMQENHREQAYGEESRHGLTLGGGGSIAKLDA